MKLIPLNVGKRPSKYKHLNQFAIVDDDDFDALNKLRWHSRKDGNIFYALSRRGTKNVKMHRVVMNVDDPKIQIDHKDRNGLNNQKSNLRKCDNSTNHKNVMPRGTSKYLGVNLHIQRVIRKNYVWESKGKWRAAIVINRKQKHLGLFPLTVQGEILAARAYDEAAKIHHGEFANLNFK